MLKGGGGRVYNNSTRRHEYHLTNALILGTFNTIMVAFDPFMGAISTVKSKRHDEIASALFGGTRISVLSLLYGNPEEAFYLRQIVRAVGKGMGATQRELTNLTSSGIVVRRKMGNQVYYKANKENPIFIELKNLILKTTGAYATIGNSLETIEQNIDFAFIYGSFARGEETVDSDIDIMVVGSAEVQDVARVLYPLSETLGRAINPTVYSREDFTERISKSNHFLTTVLKEPKHFFIGDENELGKLGEERLAEEARDQS